MKNVLGTSRSRMDKARMVALKIVELNKEMETYYSLLENGIISETQAIGAMAGLRASMEHHIEELQFYTKKK